ncbi:MAG: LytTR family transcriptional regulator [Ruminiclostridium sp.]|nr:LytTR family transcriptional regulator [Ruminiclostridium sp.]
MDIRIVNIGENEKEYIEIGCYKSDRSVDEIVRFVKSRQGAVIGSKDEKQFRLPVIDIFYIESVDDRTFIYMENDCYGSRKKLYEFEELLTSRDFVRISKAVIVNLMKIVSIRPALNGRFLCKLTNGEEVIISRKYVPEIKEKLKG